MVIVFDADAAVAARPNAIERANAIGRERFISSILR
jgi:hypothetical protein